jgi:hypothetical protein
MSAFQQALANSLPPQAQSSSSTLNIRGQSSGGPSARGLGTALRQAGIQKDGSNKMEVEGEAGRPVRGAAARKINARIGGPMDQVGFGSVLKTLYSL